MNSFGGCVSGFGLPNHRRWDFFCLRRCQQQLANTSWVPGRALAGRRIYVACSLTPFLSAQDSSSLLICFLNALKINPGTLSKAAAFSAGSSPTEGRGISSITAGSGSLGWVTGMGLGVLGGTMGRDPWKKPRHSPPPIACDSPYRAVRYCKDNIQFNLCKN